MQYKVVWTNGANVKPGPNTGGTYIRTLALGAVVEVLQDNIPDSVYPTDPNKRWVKLTDGYVASNYPNNAGVPQVRMEKVAPIVKAVAKIVVTYDDGTLQEFRPV